MNPLEQIRRGSEQVIGEERLAEQLASGKTLNVKFGVDPTRPDLTFGHLVVFNKLRQFQELGHQAILIIGDFTTLIGDPSGRSATRPVLTREEIQENARTYLDQAFQVIDREKTTVRYNSEWFDKMGFEDCLRLARQMTVARMLERDDFSKRFGEKSPISLIEFLYPLVQGRDSVEIEADIELGGSDQLFNMLVGRQLQKDAGQGEQAVLTMPLLVGLDGSKKMSKSADNFIAFNDAPKEMFGKLMSIPDDVMWDYYRLLLCEEESAVEALQGGHPMEAKKQLAVRLTSRFHGEGKGEHERAQFEQVFSRKETPDEMPSISYASLLGEGTPTTTPTISGSLAESGLVKSRKEAKRLITQGAVQINNLKVTDPNALLESPDHEHIIQAGKRIFLKVLP